MSSIEVVGVYVAAIVAAGALMTVTALLWMWAMDDDRTLATHKRDAWEGFASPAMKGKRR